jgi:DNA-directed RNA polymerase specialized sigma24 family protein
LRYDKERGGPLAAHIYKRVLAAAWTRYRQEWSYYLHCVVESRTGVEPIATSFNWAHHDEAINHFLRQALSQLSVDDQRLIQQLFWDNAGQRRVAATLQISQPCVSKRKARVLRQLRRVLNRQSHQFSHILTVCWALFDSLDLLPIVDLL